MVLPNGTVTNANPENNPDLYFALRGGGSSFGIVTRFDFEALALNKTFWGGSDVNVLAGMGATRKRLAIQDRREWSFRAAVFALIRLLHRGLDLFGYGTTLDNLASGFASLAHEQQMDAAAAAYLFFSYLPDLRTYVAGSTYVYSQNTEEPAALQPLTGVPHLYTTRRLRTLSDLTLEVTEMNPMDQRQHWRTTTFKADPALIAQFGEIFLQESAPMRYAVPDALQSTNVQLLTKHEIALSQRNGGNAFGLKPEDGPFVCMYFSKVECCFFLFFLCVWNHVLTLSCCRMQSLSQPRRTSTPKTTKSFESRRRESTSASRQWARRWAYTIRSYIPTTRLSGRMCLLALHQKIWRGCWRFSLGMIRDESLRICSRDT